MIKKLTRITTDKSFTGKSMRRTICLVTAGLVQGSRQHSGGVPMGQVVASLAIWSTPPSIRVVKMVKTSMENTETMSWRRETRGAVGGDIRAGRVRVMWVMGESWRQRT